LFPLLCLLLGLGSSPVASRPNENGIQTSTVEVCGKENGTCTNNPVIQQAAPNFKCCPNMACGEDSKCMKVECTNATVVTKCGLNARCIDYVCTCDAGYIKEAVVNNEVGCEDGNDCTTDNDCQDGDCQANQPVNYACVADECYQQCENGGRCTKVLGNVTCDCNNTGYTGDNCTELIQGKKYNSKTSSSQSP